MKNAQSSDSYKFEISLSVLNHLGRNLYRNFITVLGEAISNAWDADASNVWIDIDRSKSSFSVKDDGVGMDAAAFQSRFLKIGYSKRTIGGRRSAKNRPYIGAKGIGKLALLSCAKRISVFAKTDQADYTGGVIDNAGLDDAIKSDQSTEEYPLEQLDFELISELRANHSHGTIIYFEETNAQFRNTDEYLKKLLALNFKFSLYSEDFNIHVNGLPVTIDDLKQLSDATQFLWVINEYTDPYIEGLNNLEQSVVKIENPSLEIRGFVGSVKKPRMLKIDGTEERATIDLFVNGRLREKNIIHHIPTQRIVESYIYGQIHFDALDREGTDPFTSSREGVLENDEKFRALIDYLKDTLMPRVIGDWDEFRLKVGEEGDDENNRRSKRQRKAKALISDLKDDYKPADDAPERDRVEKWLKEITQESEFSAPAYIHCFLAENLLRKYILHNNIQLHRKAQEEIEKCKKGEQKNKCDANISFEIRKNATDLNYVGMSNLALTVEVNGDESSQSLYTDAKAYRPIRDAIAHTSSLTDQAKKKLDVTSDNIKARLNTIISGQ